MYCLMAMVVVIAVLLVPISYYAFAKLTYTAYVCGSFAKLDGQIGWVHKPSVSSCLGGRDPWSSAPPWFEASVYTDANGFRAARPGAATPHGGIITAGDSWTFGYGVTFEESYPGRLERLSGVPVINMASPAYSSAQGLLLAERWVGRLRPSAVVYLEVDQWQRNVCVGSYRPSAVLKPCYWLPPGGAQAELVLPPAGRVEHWAAWDVLPGGMIGPGEMTWPYFLVSRPVTQVLNLLVRLGLISGFAHDFAAPMGDHAVMRGPFLVQLGRVAEAANVPVLFVDVNDFISPEMIQALPPRQAVLIHRIGKEQWQREVLQPAALLPASEQAIPHDPHFSPAVNGLIAGMLARELRKLGVIDLADPTPR
jgi:hypothetical protein